MERMRVGGMCGDGNPPSFTSKRATRGDRALRCTQFDVDTLRVWAAARLSRPAASQWLVQCPGLTRCPCFCPVLISRIVKSRMRSSLCWSRFTTTGQLLQKRFVPPRNPFSASIVAATTCNAVVECCG